MGKSIDSFVILASTPSRQSPRRRGHEEVQNMMTKSKSKNIPPLTGLLISNPDRLDQVLKAARQELSAPPEYLSNLRQVTLISQHAPTLEFRAGFREFQMFVRAGYGVRMRVVGGGYGCIRLNVELNGAGDEAVKQFLHDLKHKQPELKKRTEALQIVQLIDDTQNEQIDLTHGTSYVKTQKVVDAPRLDTIPELIQNINFQLTVLEQHLNPVGADGISLFKEYRQTLGKLMPALTQTDFESLLDHDALRLLNHLVDTTKAKNPQAHQAAQKIWGSIDKIIAQRFPSKT
jgi:hypothetical protein